MNSLMQRSETKRLLTQPVNYWGEIAELTSTFMKWQQLGWVPGWALSVEAFVLAFPRKVELARWGCSTGACFVVGSV